VKLTRAAGGIVWRVVQGTPRVAVVHRPTRGDWSLPKGKLDPGEGWQEGARREIAEETGCEVRLGRYAGAKLHLDRPQPKLTLYWHARLVREGPLPDQDEVDEVAWLSRREALDRLDHASDRRLLLWALGDRTEVGAWDGRRAQLAPEALSDLVVVDSRKAAEALPDVLGMIALAVTSAASRSEARRA
jgi:ADP-ribose pyrophosphatase YjhB (NUDIX family)